ncbi:MAG: hypothetical protein M1450_01830 [Patescibacteria group bacterium]|nr:hypothetical protein [Patescibacteria group bacterium]
MKERGHQASFRSKVVRGVGALGVAVFPMSVEFIPDSKHSLEPQKAHHFQVDLKDTSFGVEFQKHEVVSKNIPWITSQDEELAEIAKTDEAKWMMGAGLLFAGAGGTSAFLLGRKYDDPKLQVLRTLPYATLGGSMASGFVESIYTEPRLIPAGLFAATLFLQAAYTAIRATETEGKVDNLTSCYGVSAALAIAGGTILKIATQ